VADLIAHLHQRLAIRVLLYRK